MRKTLIGIVAGFAAASVFWQATNVSAVGGSGGFSIVVTMDNSMAMKCENGCAWSELRYDCGDKSPCSVVVNERGVHGMGTE